MKIGIFGGSFDPVHREHVHFVRAAIDCLRLDKVFVMPAHNPPHKPYRVLAPDTDRLETCRLAFSCLPEVEISDDHSTTAELSVYRMVRNPYDVLTVFGNDAENVAYRFTFKHAGEYKFIIVVADAAGNQAYLEYVVTVS